MDPEDLFDRVRHRGLFVKRDPQVGVVFAQANRSRLLHTDGEVEPAALLPFDLAARQLVDPPVKSSAWTLERSSSATLLSRTFGNAASMRRWVRCIGPWMSSRQREAGAG